MRAFIRCVTIRQFEWVNSVIKRKTQTHSTPYRSKRTMNRLVAQFYSYDPHYETPMLLLPHKSLAIFTLLISVTSDSCKTRRRNISVAQSIAQSQNHV